MRNLLNIEEESSSPIYKRHDTDILGIKDFVEKYPMFTEAQIRWYRHKSTNEKDSLPFHSAFKKIGRRVFILEDEFFRIIHNS